MAQGPPPDDAPAPDVFAAGLFPVCPATHDQGIRWLFDLATAILLLDCRPGDRVLDLGAGSGFSSEMLARLGYTVVAVDPDHGAMRNNLRRPSFDAGRIQGRVVVADGVAERLPFADASFDGALAMNVLHHVPDLPAATRELARVLRPGCRVAFCEPGLDHLLAAETQRARREHGEDDRAFDVLAFLRQARDLGFSDAMLSATLQSPLRLLPVADVELFRAGRHPRPHMTDAGVLEELHRRHAFGMLVREGVKPRTSRHPGRLDARITTTLTAIHLARGGQIDFTVEAVNTGDTTWLSTRSRFGGFVTAGCKVLSPEGRLVDDTLGRTFLPHDVAPGERVSAAVHLVLPPAVAPGRYVLRLDLVNELVCWFSDLGVAPVDVPLVVTPAEP